MAEQRNIWWKPQTRWLYKAAETGRMLCLENLLHANNRQRDILTDSLDSINDTEVTLWMESTAQQSSKDTASSSSSIGRSGFSIQDDSRSSNKEGNHLKTKQLYQKVKELAASQDLEPENAAKECTQLRQFVVDLHRQGEENRKGCQSAQMEIHELKLQVQHKNEEIDWLRKLNIDTHGDTLNQAMAGIAAIIQRHMETCSLNVSMQQQLNEACEALKIEREALTQQLARSTEECRHLGYATAVAREGAEFYASKFWDLAGAQEGKPGSESDILRALRLREREKSELSEFALGLEETKEALEKELAKQATRINDLYQESEDDSAEMASLQSQVEKYKASNDSMIDISRSYVFPDDRLDMLGGYYDVVKSDNKALAKQVTELKVKLQESSDKATTWEGQYEMLRHVHSNHIDESSKFEEKNRVLDCEIFRLEMDNGALKDQVEGLNLEILALDDKVNYMGQGLVELRELPFSHQLREQLIGNQSELERLQRLLDEAYGLMAAQKEREDVRLSHQACEIKREYWDYLEQERLTKRLESAELENSKLRAALQRVDGRTR